MPFHSWSAVSFQYRQLERTLAAGNANHPIYGTFFRVDLSLVTTQRTDVSTHCQSKSLTRLVHETYNTFDAAFGLLCDTNQPGYIWQRVDSYNVVRRE